MSVKMCRHPFTTSHVDVHSHSVYVTSHNDWILRSTTCLGGHRASKMYKTLRLLLFVHVGYEPYVNRLCAANYWLLLSLQLVMMSPAQRKMYMALKLHYCASRLYINYGSSTVISSDAGFLQQGISITVKGPLGNRPSILRPDSYCNGAWSVRSAILWPKRWYLNCFISYTSARHSFSMML